MNDSLKKIRSYIRTYLLLLAFVLPLAALANCGGNGCTVDNPLGPNTTLLSLLQNILQAVIYLAVPVALLFVVLAGVRFVLAQGNEKKIAEARGNFLNTMIGIAIFFGTSLLVGLIINTLRDFGINVPL